MRNVQHVIRNRPLVAAHPHQSVFDVAVTMSDSGVGAVPVIEDERLVGVFSERDLMSRVVAVGRDPTRTTVADVMTRDVVTADVRDRGEPCVRRMRSRNCRHLPVVSDGRVIAMVSLRDFLRDELEEQKEEIRHLRAYIHQEGPH